MLKSLQKITANVKFKRKIAYTDNLVFRLHYRYTFIGLLCGVILVSSRHYFGEHIRCIADEGVPDRVIDTFCYFTNTFTVVRHYEGKDGMVPHPGVGPMTEGEPIIVHAYYQWVPYVLFLQAVMCFLPHFVWQQLEGGRVKAMTRCFQNAALASGVTPTKINEKVLIPSAGEQDLKIDQVCRAFMARLHINTLWAASLIGCEILNVLNIVLQVCLMEWFLGGHFASLGRLLVGADPGEQEDNPLDIVFPKVTKCTFHKYGPSGSIQQHDALCVMALNVVNEKIYVFLWFWYIFLFALSAGVVVYRFISMVLYSRSRTFNRYVFLMSCPVSLDTSSIKSVTRACDYGDWLFLHHLAKSMEGFVFMEVFNRLAASIDESKPTRIVNDIVEAEVEPLTATLPRSNSNIYS